MQKRIEWPDALKGAGMITFYLGHLGGHFGLIGSELGLKVMKLCASAFIAGLFALSGYFWKDRGYSFWTHVKERARARLVPVAVFHVIGIVLVLMMMAAASQLTAATAMQVFKRALEIFKGWPWFNPVAWALMCLFQIEMLQFFFDKYLKSTASRLVLCALCVFLIWAFPFRMPVLEQNQHLRGWWFMTPALALMIFYQLGVVARRYRLADRLPQWGNAVVAAVSFAVLMVTFDLNQGPYTNMPALPMVLIGFSQFGDLRWFYLNLLLGTIFLFTFSQLIARVNMMTALGRHTVVLMCLNSFFVLLVDPPLARLFYKRLGWTSPGEVFLVMVMVTLGSILVSLPLCWLVDRYAPWLAGRRKPIGRRPQEVAPPSPAAELAPAQPLP